MKAEAMTSLPIETLERQHPEYAANLELWQRCHDFYCGGEQFRRRAHNYLVKRQKEPAEVYFERLSRVFYENYIGSIIDWYAATLFRTEPQILFRGAQAGSAVAPAAPANFYHELLEDCDRAGTDFVEFFRRVFIDALVYRDCFVLVDFPRIEASAGTRAEEDALGKSRAYLVRYTPLDVINWRADAAGNFEWVVIKTSERFQPSMEQPAEVWRDTWTYFDRSEYRVYALDREPNKRVKPGAAVPLAASGRHALAPANRVPLITLRLSDGLWLSNKAALLQQEHFNKANALSWALHMGLFAMPVVYSDREWHQIVGESYYIQLSPEDRFGWTEPEGKVYRIAQDNLDQLKDEIYRICYLIVQAGGNEARNLGQSGISKERDYAVTQEVLRAYGDIVKGAIKDVLRAVIAARQDGLAVDVKGLDRFDIRDLSVELQDAVQLRQLVTHSPTFARELETRLALRYLDDSEQALKSQIAREIQIHHEDPQGTKDTTPVSS
jgi:hypothetical protein